MALRLGSVAALDQETVTELKRKGVGTRPRYLQQQPEWLVANIAGISPAVEAEARARIIAEATAFPERCDDTLRRVLRVGSAECTVVSTGCDGVDGLLGGGARTAELTELVGLSGTGKTQLCHQLAAIAGHGQGRVVYIDTNSSFSADRLAEIAAARGLSVDAVLAAVECRRATDAASVLRQLYRLLATAGTDPRAAVIVDSVAAVFTPVLARQHAKGSAMLTEAGLVLRALATTGRCAVITTNFGFRGHGGVERPGLGATWGSAVHTRVCLSRTPSRDREACLVKSTRRPTGVAAAIGITPAGIIDT